MLEELSATTLPLPTLAFVTIALICILCFMTWRSTPQNIPPFPVRPYPLVGHFPMLKDGMDKMLREWRKSTGDIFSLYMGSKLVIIITSYPIVKQAFEEHGDNFSDRPSRTYKNRNLPFSELGMLNSCGANWKEQRSVSMSILKHLEMGKNLLAEKISEERAILLQLLSDLKGEPTDIQKLVTSYMVNIFCVILAGRRFEYDDPYFTRFVTLVNENTMLLDNVTVLNSYPWLKYLPGDLFGSKKSLENELEIRNDYCVKLVEETKERGMENNFITAYYQEMRTKQDAGISTNLDEENLYTLISNMIAAGVDTTGNTLMWAVLFAIHNPEAQEKVYNEIASTIGTERSPSILDSSHMTYTNAYINETLRFASTILISLPHACTEDDEIAGYTIPKDTPVFAHLSGILNDKEVWDDPCNFRPERFLHGTDNLVVPDEFIPFSEGRRYCMGLSLVQMTLFLVLTGIFQRFKIQAEDPDNLPTLESRLKAINAPHHFRLRLIERK